MRRDLVRVSRRGLLSRLRAGLRMHRWRLRAVRSPERSLLRPRGVRVGSHVCRRLVRFLWWPRRRVLRRWRVRVGWDLQRRDVRCLRHRRAALLRGREVHRHGGLRSRRALSWRSRVWRRDAGVLPREHVQLGRARVRGRPATSRRKHVSALRAGDRSAVLRGQHVPRQHARVRLSRLHRLRRSRAAMLRGPSVPRRAPMPLAEQLLRLTRRMERRAPSDV